MNSYKIFALSFLLLLIFPLQSNFAQNDDEVIRISKIKIKGLKDIDLQELKNSMATEFPNWKPWAEKPEFVEIIFKDDIERIKSFLGDYGYYNATVKHKLNYKKDNKETLIFFGSCFLRGIGIEKENTD